MQPTALHLNHGIKGAQKIRNMQKEEVQGAIRWLFFDLGGVLFYFDFWTICTRLSRVSEKSPGQIYRLGFESGLVQDFDRGRIGAGKFHTQILDLLEVRLHYDEFVPVWCDIFHPNQVMIEMVSDLRKRGYPLCLISNTNELHFRFLQSRFPFLALFDCLTLSYQVGRLKPDEEIFRAALALAGASPWESVFVDDIPEYAAAARSVGMHGVRYLHGPGVVEALERLGVQTPSPTVR